MRIMKRSLALALALCLAIGLMIPTVSAAGTGTDADPYVLENGAITLSGTGEELLNSDDVRKAYLGG